MQTTQTGYTEMLFCSCDFDLDPMTLIYEPDPDIPKNVHAHQK